MCYRYTDLKGNYVIFKKKERKKGCIEVTQLRMLLLHLLTEPINNKLPALTG